MNRHLPSVVRRLVIGGALLLASLAAFLPDTPSVRAAEPASMSPWRLAQNDAKAAAETARDAAREASQAAKEAAREAAAAAREARRTAADAEVDIGTDADRPGRHKGIRIGIGDADRQYDSFDQFLDRDPALASMVLGIVFVVFLTPILFTGLIIWYKMRKNRMQNETMLRLAEKGIVAPADAMQAINSGRVGAALGVAASTAPLAEQARALRKQAAWSDLRKGVLMGTVGLALTLYGVVDDGSPSWIGLVLLFVGIGYCALWYFEDQQPASAAARAATPFPAPGPGDTPN
jgi:hypothetical protein